MESFILVVVLLHNMKGVAIPVSSSSACDQASIQWLKEARKWAKRSGISDLEPMTICYPESIYNQVSPL